jgi:hypothetical protein
VKHRIEAVRWIDAHFTDDTDNPRSGEPIEVLSAGLLVKDTKAAVVLALEWYEDGSYRDILAIPKGMVKSRKRLATIAEKRGGTTKTPTP